VSCPLCAGAARRSSWLGSTTYAGQTFDYVDCAACGSLYCDPMPADEILARMYGPEYQGVLADPGEAGERELARVLRFLSQRSSGPGTFVDYGCGRGRLLTEAARLGWRSVGVEFDDAVAAAVARDTGARILGLADAHR